MPLLESSHSGDTENQRASSAARRGSFVTSGTRGLLILMMLMTSVAGFVDAVGYVRLGQLYLSFMSGNSTRWGMALASGDFRVIRWGAANIVTLVLGAMLGSLVVPASGRFKLICVLNSELLCLAIALALAALSVEGVALLPSALAMGMQNAAHQVIHALDTGKTFITGTLVSLGQALAKMLSGHARTADAAASLASWCAFVAGVFLGAVSLKGFGLNHALQIATATMGILVVIAWPHTATAAMESAPR